MEKVNFPNLKLIKTPTQMTKTTRMKRTQITSYNSLKSKSSLNLKIRGKINELNKKFVKSKSIFFSDSQTGTKQTWEFVSVAVQINK